MAPRPDNPRFGNWRSGTFGVALLFVVPVLILLVAGLFWWGYLGTDDMLQMEPAEIREPIPRM